MNLEETDEDIAGEMNQRVNCKDEAMHIKNLKERSVIWWSSKADNN